VLAIAIRDPGNLGAGSRPAGAHPALGCQQHGGYRPYARTVVKDGAELLPRAYWPNLASSIASVGAQHSEGSPRLREQVTQNAEMHPCLLKARLLFILRSCCSTWPV
jgi:hypothetical protein